LIGVRDVTEIAVLEPAARNIVVTARAHRYCNAVPAGRGTAKDE